MLSCKLHPKTLSYIEALIFLCFGHKKLSFKAVIPFTSPAELTDDQDDRYRRRELP